MTEDLVAFLRARLDEDERTARGSSGTEWWEHPENWVTTTPANRVALVLHDGDRSHILRHHPARVLREVEAKRRLLEDVLPEIQSADESIIGEWNHDPDNAGALLRTMALAYADHPDYRDEWPPSGTMEP